MDPVVLDRRFQPWRYGVGHSQLLLHSPAGNAHEEHVNALFEGVVAVKLRRSYRPLILQVADRATRAEILAFAQIPERHQEGILCLTLPTQEPDIGSGFIACARATILATHASAPRNTDIWAGNPTILHHLRHAPSQSPHSNDRQHIDP